MNLADLRREYTQGGLRRADLDPNPLGQFHKWFEQALKSELLEPSAMTLATADHAGLPSARIVLLKAADERGFTFFTNYESRKGTELAENPRAALVLYWAELERESGEHLFLRCGGFFFGPEGHPEMVATEGALKLSLWFRDSTRFRVFTLAAEVDRLRTITAPPVRTAAKTPLHPPSAP